MGRSSQWEARGLALLAVCLWGASYLWAKTVLDWLSPFTASGARYGIAAIILLALALRQGNPFAVLRGHWRGYMLVGGIGVAGYQALLFSSLLFTSPVGASVIMALTPGLTALGAGLFLGEALTARASIGIAVAVFGAALAVLGANPRGLAGLSLNAGDVLALGAAFCMAFYTIGARRFLRRDVPTVTNVSVVMVIGALCLLPLALHDAPGGLPASSAPVAALACLVLGSTVVTYLAWNRAIALIGVREPNVIFNLMPVVTILLAAMAGHPPYAEQVVGAVIVILGVTLSIVGPRPTTARAIAK